MCGKLTIEKLKVSLLSYGCDIRSGGTIYSATDVPGGPILRGTDFEGGPSTA